MTAKAPPDSQHRQPGIPGLVLFPKAETPTAPAEAVPAATTATATLHHLGGHGPKDVAWRPKGCRTDSKGWTWKPWETNLSVYIITHRHRVLPRPTTDTLDVVR